MDKRGQPLLHNKIFTDFIDVSGPHGYHQIAGLAIFQKVFFDLVKSFKAQARVPQSFDLLSESMRADPQVVGLPRGIDRGEQNVVRQRQGFCELVHQSFRPGIGVGLERAVELSVREIRGGPERGLDLGGMMRVVIDNGKAVPFKRSEGLK